MTRISLGLVPANIHDEKGPGPDVVSRSGSFLGAMGSSFSAPPEVSPSTGDVKTAELLGERVANLTAKFSANNSAEQHSSRVVVLTEGQL